MFPLYRIIDDQNRILSAGIFTLHDCFIIIKGIDGASTLTIDYYDFDTGKSIER